MPKLGELPGKYTPLMSQLVWTIFTSWELANQLGNPCISIIFFWKKIIGDEYLYSIVLDCMFWDLNKGVNHYMKCWSLRCNSQYPGYTWRHLVDSDLSCHMMVLGLTGRFLPHTVKSFHSSFHTNNMAENDSC